MTQHQPTPHGGQYPQGNAQLSYTAPAKPRRTTRTVAITLTFVLGVFVLAAIISDAPKPAPSPTPSVPGIGRELAVASVTAPPVVPSPLKTPPAAAEFTVTLKVTEKKCYGSAGCNVKVEPAMAYTGTSPSTVDGCDVTYTVTGHESGDIVETAYNVGGLDFRVQTTFVSTKNSKVTPLATVTGVTCR